MRVDMDKVQALWLADHPGGTREEFARASRLFSAERGSRHRRVHTQFFEWVNLDHVQRAMLCGEMRHGN